jgi:hypothetical protein
MKLFKHRSLIIAFVMMASFFLFMEEVSAQKILKDTTFIIVKQFQPTIADAFKINNIPVVKDSTPPIPKINYGINSKRINTEYAVEPIKPAKMVGEPLSKLYSSLIKLGAGTHLYGEGFINNLRSKEASYGAHVKHHSWNGTLKGLGYSGFSDNQAEVYGKKFFHKQTLSGNLDYNRNVIHYYGYDTTVVKSALEKDSLKQRYSRIGGDLQFQTHYTDTTSINTFVKLKYYHLSDLYKTFEDNLLAEGDVSGYYDRQLVHIPVSVDYLADHSSVDFYNYKQNSLITKLSPYITILGLEWEMQVGVNLALETGTQKDHFYFSPNIEFSYNVLKDIIIPYAGVTGGLQRNSMNTLFTENAFLIPRPNLMNTNTKLNIYGGIKGSITSYLSYVTQASYAKYGDMYFFQYDRTDKHNSGFNLMYEDASVLNIHGEIQFQHTEKIKFFAKGDYNQYTMESHSKPWYKPIWQTTFSANYNLKNKLIATADVFIQGKRFTTYETTYVHQGNVIVAVSSTKELKPFVDANLGLEYRYSKKLSGFITLNNLAFKRYELWSHYPVQNFTFLAGITMVF